MDANAAGAPAPSVDEAALQKRVASGTGWFLWIAALSLVNSAAVLSGSTWNFLIGLGMTQVVDGFAQGMVQAGAPPALRFVAFGIDLVIAGLFFGAGLLARRGRAGVCLAGMIVYGLDAFIGVAFQDWPMAGFHAFALFYLGSGYPAIRQLRAASAAVPLPAVAAVPVEVPRTPLVR